MVAVKSVPVKGGILLHQPAPDNAVRLLSNELHSTLQQGGRAVHGRVLAKAIF
jgi:hypothetical protein